MLFASQVLTSTVHPPAGATALIAVLSPLPQWAGFLYVLIPVASGAATMLLVALLVNNCHPGRTYPVRVGGILILRRGFKSPMP